MNQPDCPFCGKLATLTPADDDLVRELPHSVVLLGLWQFYQGYCIVVARRHARELGDLSNEERHGYFDDMCRVARAILDGFHPHKLNYELLGNQVEHLHWHVFPRYSDDPDALKPVWLALERGERDPAEKRRLQTGPCSRSTTLDLLRQRLQ